MDIFYIIFMKRIFFMDNLKRTLKALYKVESQESTAAHINLDMKNNLSRTDRLQNIGIATLLFA